MHFDRNHVILHNHMLIPNLTVTDAVYNQGLARAFSEFHNDSVGWGLSSDCSLEHQLSQAAEGTGLAFIVFTQAIVALPCAPIWAVLFFTMLLSLGLGSQIGLLEGMLCTLFDIDLFKRLRKQYVTGKRNVLLANLSRKPCDFQSICDWKNIECFAYRKQKLWFIAQVTCEEGHASNANFSPFCSVLCSNGVSVLLCGRIDILYGCRWILAQNVRLIRWNDWIGGDCLVGNVGGRLYLWTWKVSGNHAKLDRNHAKLFDLVRILTRLRVFFSRFTEDIYQMTGYRPGIYWQWTWRYIGPVIMVCILVSSVVCLALDTPTYNAYKKELVSLRPSHTFYLDKFG